MNRYVAGFIQCLKRFNLRTLFFVLGVGALLAMVYAADPHALWDGALRVSWAFPMAVGIWGMAYLLNTFSFDVIIRRNVLAFPMTFFSLFRYTVTGYAINYITPFGLLGGEPYRVLELKSYLGTERATGSVLLYAMMHISSHFLFWMISCVLIALSVTHLSISLSITLLIVVFCCVICLYLFFKVYRQGMLLKWANKLKRWPIIGKRIQKISPQGEERLRMIDDNIGSLLLHHPNAFCKSLILELLARFVNCFEILCIMIALGCTVSYADAVIVVALSSLFANLLFFSPLQLGTREGGIFLSLSLLDTFAGVGEKELLGLAVTISLATRLREFVWIAIGLLFLKIRRGRNVF